MKTKVLLVEDEELIRITICELLQHNNFDIISEKDGFKAIEILKKWKPDVIISDIMMPNCDGYEFLKIVRSNPKYNQIPFLFLTAKKPETDLIEANIKGADAFIVKPFKTDELIATIEVKIKRYQELKYHSDMLDIQFDEHIFNEIDTPLKNISSTIEFLIENHTSSQKTDHYDTIKNSAEKLDRTLTKIINYQKIISESYVVHKDSSIDIDSCLLECLEKIKNCQPHFKNKITTKIEKTLIKIYRKDILFIVYELLENAIKFSNSEIKIIGEIKKDFYVLKIIDSGIGMNQNQLKNIGSLIQYDIENNEEKGVGLGLFLSKKIIECYDGKLKINSTEGKGTKIELTIPLA